MTMQFGKRITEEVYRNGQVSNKVVQEVVSILVTNNAQYMSEIISMTESAKPNSEMDLRVKFDGAGRPARIVRTFKVEGE